MDALEFLKEYKRMCTECKSCFRCPLKGDDCSICDELSEEQMINIVDKTEQWSKEHPIITNAQKFEEVFGSVPSHKISSSWTTTNPDNESRIMTEDYIGIKVGWWDEPYKEPEKEET